jgi:hypothetical protein
VLWSQHNTGQLLTVEEGALRSWSVADAAVQVGLIVVIFVALCDVSQLKQHSQSCSNHLTRRQTEPAFTQHDIHLAAQQQRSSSSP